MARHVKHRRLLAHMQVVMLPLHFRNASAGWGARQQADAHGCAVLRLRMWRRWRGAVVQRRFKMRQSRKCYIRRGWLSRKAQPWLDTWRARAQGWKVKRHNIIAAEAHYIRFWKRRSLNRMRTWRQRRIYTRTMRRMVKQRWFTNCTSFHFQAWRMGVAVSKQERAQQQAADRHYARSLRALSWRKWRRHVHNSHNHAAAMRFVLRRYFRRWVAHWRRVRQVMAHCFESMEKAHLLRAWRKWREHTTSVTRQIYMAWDAFHEQHRRSGQLGRWWRRRLVRLQELALEAAACSIQCSWRQHAARRLYRKVLFRHRLRMYDARMVEVEAMEVEDALSQAVRRERNRASYLVNAWRNCKVRRNQNKLRAAAKAAKYKHMQEQKRLRMEAFALKQARAKEQLALEARCGAFLVRLARGMLGRVEYRRVSAVGWQLLGVVSVASVASGLRQQQRDLQ